MDDEPEPETERDPAPPEVHLQNYDDRSSSLEPEPVQQESVRTRRRTRTATRHPGGPRGLGARGGETRFWTPKSLQEKMAVVGSLSGFLVRREVRRRENLSTHSRRMEEEK